VSVQASHVFICTLHAGEQDKAQQLIDEAAALLGYDESAAKCKDMTGDGLEAFLFRLQPAQGDNILMQFQLCLSDV
jgi:hypothetical protein